MIGYLALSMQQYYYISNGYNTVLYNLNELKTTVLVIGNDEVGSSILLDGTIYSIFSMS